MRLTILNILTVATLLFSGGFAFSDFSERSEALNKRYDEERARGLIGLNKRYLEDFRKKQEAAVKAGNLEGAVAIRDKIAELEAEISKLGEKLEEAEMTTEAKAPIEELSLEGKTGWFPHDNDPEKTVGFKFLENGEAVWIGLGGIEVERQYKELGEPRKFQVWWSQRTGNVGYEVTVAEDGKTAAVKNLASGFTAEGEIKRTR